MENEIESGEHETKEKDFLHFALICVPSDSELPYFQKFSVCDLMILIIYH